MLRNRSIVPIILATIGACFHLTEVARPPADGAVYDTIKACTFNVQIFGQTKMSKPDVVQILLQIFDRYDLTSMQEIRDSAETAFPEFVRQLNEYSQHTYGWAVGVRKGKSSSKEQYGFVYRVDKLKLVEIYEWEDTDDIFQRPPSVAQFEDLQTGLTFVYIPIHTDPGDAVAEMNGLVSVYNDVTTYFDTDNAIIAGDFNAGYTYVCKSCWVNVELLTDQRFFWIISTYANTTVAKSQNAYDRIVLGGEHMVQQARNPHVFRYDTLWNIDAELAKDVSDHYPVGYEIYL